MVKTTTRPKCARIAKTKAQATAEDQIDAALDQKLHAVPSAPATDYPASLVLRPFDILKLSKEDFARSGDADDEEMRLRRSEPQNADRYGYREKIFCDRSCELEDLAEMFPSQSVSDACAQVYLAIAMLDRITDNDLKQGDCERYVRRAKRMLLGAWGPIATASERPLWEIVDLYPWMKAAQEFGDVERAKRIHEARCGDSEDRARLLFPTPVPTEGGDDKAFIRDCDNFAEAEAAWQAEFNAAKTDAEGDAVNARWGDKRDLLVSKVFEGRATTLAGHAARARAIAVESGWQDHTIESMGWSEGMLAALVRDLIGGAA